MKKIFTLFILVASFVATAQSTIINGSVSLTQNSHFIDSPQYLELHTNNCNIINGDISVNGDLNLNGFILFLKQNTYLNVTGNINGPGQIISCNNGNGNSSISVCTSGSIQNNPNLNNIGCSSLDTQTFVFSRDLGYNYVIYNELTQVIGSGVTNLNMYYDLPKNQILFLKVEGFKGFGFKMY